jgi:hypothetical protein
VEEPNQVLFLMSNLLRPSVVKHYQRRRRSKKIKCAERLGVESSTRGRAKETTKDADDLGEKLPWKISVTVGTRREVSGEDR